MAGRITYYGGIVTQGLVLDLDAAKRDSYPGTGTVWNDISGNQNNGTLVNGPTFSSTNGGLITFDGVDDYSNLGTRIQNYSVFTTSFWINYLVFSTSHRSPLGDSFQLYSYHIIFLNGGMFLGFSSGYTGLPYTDAVPHNTVSINNWYNFVITKNYSDDITFYQNGVSLGTTNKSGAVSLTSIGKGYVYDNARISNVLFYNKALSSTEVLQNYNATKGRFGL